MNFNLTTGHFVLNHLHTVINIAVGYSDQVLHVATKAQWTAVHVYVVIIITYHFVNSNIKLCLYGHIH